MRPTPEQGPPARERGEGVRPGAISALLQDLVRPAGPRESAWSATLRPGAVIGRFELVREIGRGGFGVVWEARDRTLGRTVAFKAIRVEGSAGAMDERVQREAEAAARLSHPNIVTLHDVGTCDDGPFLVLELLRGQTLAQRMEQGRLSVREAVRIAHEVAKGLAHAHAHGVVHRDLTPGNVFLCEDGQVKILDLGMAHAFGQRKLDGGTPAYMAPEQSQGAPEDERSDVYALGVVLYRLLANELPFRERQRRLPGSGASPRLDVAEAPGLGDLVARMLERDPVQRPRDAAVVRDALAAIHQELDRTPSSTTVAKVRKRRRWAVYASLGVVAVLVLLAAVVLVRQQVGLRRAAQGGASVAVLPFADMSPQKDQEYFADGLSEEILNALANVDGLRVAGRTSSFAFKGQGEDLRAIGQKLNVASVLEGSVRKAGNRVRISAQLINLADGFHLWSETFDRELTDIFAVQDEIARAVAGALRGKLLAAGAPPRSRATNPEAYTQYLLGRQWYARFTPEGTRRAAEHFEKSIALDPSYAPAWASLAVQLYNQSPQGHGEATEETRARLQRALAAAEKAVELDPGFGEGYATRGLMRGTIRWDWTGAQADMERAIALSPSDATIARRRSLLLASLGRTAEALDAARKATDLDPLFASNWLALGNVYATLGDWQQARAALDRVREIAPDYEGLDTMSAGLALCSGDAAGALALSQNLKDEDERWLGEAFAYHALGRTRDAQEALDQVIARYGEKKPIVVAAVYAWRDDPDHAFEWLERAYARHGMGIADLKQDWFLSKKLRNDPRYADLLRRMNLPVP